VFDIDLAKQHSSDNPVYYVQYAHARICRIFESAGETGACADIAAARVDLLDTTEELNIIRTLAAFPEIVQGAADNFEPHRLAGYLHDLASQLHAFYNRHRVLGDDPALTTARLYLLARVRQTIANALAILGVTAPERM
jgi:arginyl-tRNA synthetase